MAARDQGQWSRCYGPGMPLWRARTMPARPEPRRQAVAGTCWLTGLPLTSGVEGRESHVRGGHQTICSKSCAKCYKKSQAGCRDAQQQSPIL